METLKRHRIISLEKLFPIIVFKSTPYHYHFTMLVPLIPAHRSAFLFPYLAVFSSQHSLKFYFLSTCWLTISPNIGEVNEGRQGRCL